MKIYAFDFETANPDYASICQFGLAEFTNGELTDTYETLIDPEDYFDEYNTSEVHGISQEDVIGKPKFNLVYEKLNNVKDYIILHHSSFDKSAYRQACEKYSLTPANLHFMDTTMVVRRAWEQFRDKGYGLENVATHMGIQYNSHNALEDAITCGIIFFEAVKYSGIQVEDWPARLKLRLDGSPYTYIDKISKDGNPEGEYYGQTVLFTGKANIPRHELATLASQIGFKVAKSFSKKVNLLVVGLQDKSKLKAGHDKSDKHEKAIEYNKHGGNIRIISDESFYKFFDDFHEN
jgi:DNA polymerase-3 subunit epsilon